MDDLQQLLEQAWSVRQRHFPPILGADNPRSTRSLSLTGAECALDCAHCGRHYLEAMLPVAGLAADDPRLKGVSSLLISGGCDRLGRVPVTAHLEQIRAVRPGRRLNWHTGLIGEEDWRAIAGLADVVSFDLVGDNETIAEVYGLEASVEDYRASYRMLRRHVRTIPHITIGLRGGRRSGERAALQVLQEEGAEAIVFLVLIPTPGTRYGRRVPPPVGQVVRLLAEARLAFPDTPLVLGCMRPGGPYRRELDPLAVRAGINRIVKPGRATLEAAAGLGLQVEHSQECCVLSLPGPSPDRARDEPAGPAEIRVSAGTEVVLGLRDRPTLAVPTTAYLMVDGGGCAMNCAFCAQARDSLARDDALSRIVWPAHPTEQVLAALEDAGTDLGRVCFQVTLHRGAVGEVKALVQDLRRHTSRPVSVAIRPPDAEAMAELFAAGVDVIGLGLDCAGERVYREVKGAGWQRMMDLLEQSSRRFPGRVRVHLMIGLGETEEELCHTMQQIYDWGSTVGLFAFTPVRGTALQGRPQPALDVYRRMQVARYLLHNTLGRAGQFRFDGQGRLVDFGRPDLRVLLADGEAFRTSGCPHCNRPFYNERPGGTMYNYPRPLTPQEAEQALGEMGLPGW